MIRTNRHFFSFFAAVVVTSAIFLANCGDNPSDGGDGDDGGNGGSTIDTIPPAQITEILVKSPTSTTLTLQWQAPGDDGDVGRAATYDLRWAEVPVTEQNWLGATRVSGIPAPRPAGQVEQWTVRELPSGTAIYFAIRAYDEVQNASELSLSATGTTKPEYIAPARTTDLVAIEIAETQYELTWTAPGDDDATIGTASEYDIRYSINQTTIANFTEATQVEGEPAPLPAGESERFVVTVPLANETYYFALKTADEVPNWSPVSNVARGFGIDENMVAHPGTAYLDRTESVQLVYRTPGPGDVMIDLTRMRDGWPYGFFIFKHLVDDYLDAGIYNVTWYMDDDEGVVIDPRWDTMVTFRLHLNDVPVDSVQIRVFIEYTTSTR